VRQRAVLEEMITIPGSEGEEKKRHALISRRKYAHRGERKNENRWMPPLCGSESHEPEALCLNRIPQG